MTHGSEVVCVLWAANWTKYWAMVDIGSTTWEPQWITRTTCDPRELHGVCKETQCRLNRWKLETPCVRVWWFKFHTPPHPNPKKY